MNRELPILFNTEMVRAILEGRKTVTRRVINRDITNRCDVDTDGTLLCFEDEYGDHISPEKLSRYQVGDILYVRETWNICNMDIENDSITFIYKADEPYEDKKARTVRVSDEIYDKYNESIAESNPEWRPSIHMPKEAARIWLKVTAVRVERLQEINCQDIMKEGMNPKWCVNLNHMSYKFQKLWDSTIKKSERDLYGWDANPWVFVYEFERIEHGQG